MYISGPEKRGLKIAYSSWSPSGASEPAAGKGDRRPSAVISPPVQSATAARQGVAVGSRGGRRPHEAACCSLLSLAAPIAAPIAAGVIVLAGSEGGKGGMLAVEQRGGGGVGIIGVGIVGGPRDAVGGRRSH